VAVRGCGSQLVCRCNGASENTVDSIGKLGLKMTDVRCDCGAIYRETSVKFPLRDKDKFNCERCGVLIKEWNATT
jgi:hypothetical protein